MTVTMGQGVPESVGTAVPRYRSYRSAVSVEPEPGTEAISTPNFTA